MFEKRWQFHRETPEETTVSTDEFFGKKQKTICADSSSGSSTVFACDGYVGNLTEKRTTCEKKSVGKNGEDKSKTKQSASESTSKKSSSNQQLLLGSDSSSNLSSDLSSNTSAGNRSISSRPSSSSSVSSLEASLSLLGTSEMSIDYIWYNENLN